MATEKRIHTKPLRELEEMYRRFGDDIARPFMRSMWEHIPEGMKGYFPAIDVFEKGDDLVFKAELPGIKYEDIGVSISDDTLVIKGEKQADESIKEEDYYRSEIAYGSFNRTVALPFSVDTKNVEAVYEDGVLYVTLKNASAAKSQKIEVKVKQEKPKSKTSAT